MTHWSRSIARTTPFAANLWVTGRDPEHAPAAWQPAGLTQRTLTDALCLAAATPEQALVFACRTSPLWCSANASLLRDGDSVSVCSTLGLAPEGAESWTRCIALVFVWLRLVERVAATVIYPQSLHLPSVPENDRRDLRRNLGCVIHFDRPMVAVEFRAAELQCPNPNADETLVALLSRYAEDQLAVLGDAEGVASQVRRLLSGMADVTSASAEGIAAALGIGVRTLHRRLSAERTSYRRLVQEFRLERCAERLRFSSTSAKEIAFALGYANPASFHRAFRRWTGGTVGEYRQRGDPALLDSKHDQAGHAAAEGMDG